ncbi:MAG: hypothetical protein ABJN40_10770 [Sneathiella sp.]
MEITKMSFDEFMCTGNQTITATPVAFEISAPSIEEYIRNEIKKLNKQYTLNELDTDLGDVALLSNGEFVGFYTGEALAIRSDHRGKGLSTPMILEAIVARPCPTKRTLSCSGKKALEKAWRVANGQAVSP